MTPPMAGDQNPHPPPHRPLQWPVYYSYTVVYNLDKSVLLAQLTRQLQQYGAEVAPGVGEIDLCITQRDGPHEKNTLVSLQNIRCNPPRWALKIGGGPPHQFRHPSAELTLRLRDWLATSITQQCRLRYRALKARAGPPPPPA